MVRSADRRLAQSLRETFAALAPFPGRLATSWRIGATCALVAGIAMLFHIPESAISCYLVIYLMKDDGAENTLVAIGAVLAITLLVALMIPVLQWTVESTLVRVLLMVVVSVVFIFIGAATKLGEGGSIVALIIAFILTLVSVVPANGVISTGLRFAWEMAILPMFVIAGFNLFFGRWSPTLLREELRQRLILAGDALRGSAMEPLRRKLEEGNDANDLRLLLVKLLHQTSRKNAQQMRTDSAASWHLLYAISALPANELERARERFATSIDDMVWALAEGRPLPAFPEPETDDASPQIAAMAQALRNITGTDQTDYEKSRNDGFFAPDAFSNPRYLQFALKTTLAAISCYLLYTIINWQGIHTAMVTCYVASLSTTGDTVHKLGLRISGCLIGAALGIGSIIWLLPNMDSIGALMLLVFAVALLSGWLVVGSEKISYAGVQIGLAFTLTVLQGFGPTTDFDTARDRIIGVLIGNFAVFLAQTLIWPTPVRIDIRNIFTKVAADIRELAATPPQQRQQRIATVSQIEKKIGKIRYHLYLAPFEPRSLRLDLAEEENYKRIIETLGEIGREVYFSTDPVTDAPARLTRLKSLLPDDQPVAAPEAAIANGAA